jgi:hypothetical protein
MILAAGRAAISLRRAHMNRRRWKLGSHDRIIRHSKTVTNHAGEKNRQHGQLTDGIGSPTKHRSYPTNRTDAVVFYLSTLAPGWQRGSCD